MSKLNRFKFSDMNDTRYTATLLWAETLVETIFVVLWAYYSVRTCMLRCTLRSWSTGNVSAPTADSETTKKIDDGPNVAVFM